MKIVFLGTPQFAVPSLEALFNDPGIEVLSVITRPDKPVGRKKTLTPSPVKLGAKKLSLKVIQPKNSRELIEKLKDIKADFFVVIAFGMILPKEILKMPKYGAINIHASLLPKYRGASPIHESILNGDKETGVTIMKIDEELDHGPIYLMKRIQIEESDDLETLNEKLADIGKEIIPHVLKDIIEGTLKPITQNHKNATYCRKIKKEDGKIDWNLSAEKIKNMIRAYSKWPVAYTNFNNKKLKIIEATTEKTNSNKTSGTFFIENNSLKISTKNGNIIPKKVQLEGKKEMDINSFLNGYKNLIK